MNEAATISVTSNLKWKVQSFERVLDQFHFSNAVGVMMDSLEQ